MVEITVTEIREKPFKEMMSGSLSYLLVQQTSGGQIRHRRIPFLYNLIHNGEGGIPGSVLEPKSVKDRFP
jgi:hypothetical protein